ncbi:GTPase RsgA [Paenibacillus chungangensis]|uniref:GTPase RsgA n=1 Tax=Paenibacillus chungangensis TaxID=696535 RepID=A0ABW3HNT2_9BACL
MMDLKQYGYIEDEAPPKGLIPGRITELQRDQYTVITERGEVTAVLKGAFYHTAGTREDFPCVGDFVFLQYNESGSSRIANLLPRRSKFSRADYSGHAAGYAKTILEQVVATNFDYVFIVSSLNWDFKVSRIMRYLTQTRQSGGQPVVILTKADLVPDFSAPLAEVQGMAANVPVHAVSSHAGNGLKGLALRRITGVFRNMQMCRTSPIIVSTNISLFCSDTGLWSGISSPSRLKISHCTSIPCGKFMR